MTKTPSPLRVKSAQEAIDLLYNHFIKNRHRPAFLKDERVCYAMPANAVYPRCAVGLLTKPSAIRASYANDPDSELADIEPAMGVYLSNDNEAVRLLNNMTTGGTFGYRLQEAHDQAASRNHYAIDAAHPSGARVQHTSFRSAFTASLRSICAHYNLEYPGDR